VVTGDTCRHQGFVWSVAAPAGAFVPSQPALDEEVSPTGINAAGDIVGFQVPSVFRGVVYAFESSEGRMTRLPPLADGLSASANDINQGGTIVGQAGPSWDTETAVYWLDGEIHQIEGVQELGGDHAVATAVN
jgi:uncharacterized membrane protein